MTVIEWLQKSVSVGECGRMSEDCQSAVVCSSVVICDCVVGCFVDGQVLGCLPKAVPWSIPPRELEYRRDLRSQCVFTIDPSTARDLDDAVSCDDLGDGWSGG